VDWGTIRLPVPDYSKASNFTTSTYTAPSDGFIRVAADLSSLGKNIMMKLRIEVTRNGQTEIVSDKGMYSDGANQYNHYYITPIADKRHKTPGKQ